MQSKAKKRKAISLESALHGIGASARRRAFLRKKPVAISINGKTFLQYQDGSRKLVTPELLEQLRNGQA